MVIISSIMAALVSLHQRLHRQFTYSQLDQNTVLIDLAFGIVFCHSFAMQIGFRLVREIFKLHLRGFACSSFLCTTSKYQILSTVYLFLKAT